MRTIKRDILTRKPTNSFNKHLSRFAQNRHRRSSKKSSDLLTVFMTSKRRRSEERNQTQSGELDSGMKFTGNLKCYWDTKEEWQLLFASSLQSMSEKATPWMMENQNVINWSFLRGIFFFCRCLGEFSPTFLPLPKSDGKKKSVQKSRK